MSNTTETLTITDFLLARIAEDETAAQDALERGFGGWEDFADRGANYEERTHIARHHPTRVLAECEAKRRIVELHYSWNLEAERHPEPPFGPILQAKVTTAETILRTLASVYIDHPDHRDEWRP